jgi:hypothetical protein
MVSIRPPRISFIAFTHSYLATKLGFGMHMWDIRASEIITCLKVLKIYVKDVLLGIF